MPDIESWSGSKAYLSESGVLLNSNRKKRESIIWSREINENTTHSSKTDLTMVRHKRESVSYWTLARKVKRKEKQENDLGILTTKSVEDCQHQSIESVHSLHHHQQENAYHLDGREELLCWYKTKKSGNWWKKSKDERGERRLTSSTENKESTETSSTPHGQVRCQPHGEL